MDAGHQNTSMIMRKKCLILCGVLSIATIQTKAQTPVSHVPEIPYSVATNSFLDNWELSVGLDAFAFYSNQENSLNLPKSPFKGFRNNLGLSFAATKWFSPDIALRTKANGIWGRSVISDNKELNATKFYTVQEQAMLNLSNMILDYDPLRLWNIIPYAGVGFARNCSANRYSLIANIGVMNTWKIADKIKAFFDFGITMAGDDFDDYTCTPTTSKFKSHDRWLTAEVGLTFSLGKNTWKKTPDIDAIQIDYHNNGKEYEERLEKANHKIERLSTQIKRMKSETKQVATQTVDNYPDVSIFFELRSSTLPNKKQLENIKVLVEKAKAENRTIVVTGYADSSTGNTQQNEMLSAKRADTIVKELLEMGIDAQKIKIVIGGGVNTLDIIPANRRVVVSLEK